MILSWSDHCTAFLVVLVTWAAIDGAAFLVVALSVIATAIREPICTLSSSSTGLKQHPEAHARRRQGAISISRPSLSPAQPNLRDPAALVGRISPTSADQHNEAQYTQQQRSLLPPVAEPLWSVRCRAGFHGPTSCSWFYIIFFSPSRRQWLWCLAQGQARAGLSREAGVHAVAGRKEASSPRGCRPLSMTFRRRSGLEGTAASL